MQTVFTAERLWDGQRVIHRPMVFAEEGRILTIKSRDTSEIPAGLQVRDFGAATLGPAFFDVHIHGSAGHDVMEATPDALQSIGGFLPSHGTGPPLATTLTATFDSTTNSLTELATFIRPA